MQRKEDRSVTTASDVWSVHCFAYHLPYRDGVLWRVNAVTTVLRSLFPVPCPLSRQGVETLNVFRPTLDGTF